MTLKPFTPALDPARRADILARLDAIEADHDVRILFAVESGSRAWGFPSPDSDYDARFVYVHRPDWYLSLEAGRDVIELPIDDELDINGWELRKALNLLLKPNPVLLEWLCSPLRYRWDEGACARLEALAAEASHETACRYHYLHLGRKQVVRHLEGETAKLKRYFYVLRPALALRWLRLRGDAPPMNLQALCAGVDLPGETLAAIDALLDKKAVTRELGEGPRVPALDALIVEELALAEAAPAGPRGPDLRGPAEALFRDLVKEGAR